MRGVVFSGLLQLHVSPIQIKLHNTRLLNCPAVLFQDHIASGQRHAAGAISGHEHQDVVLVLKAFIIFPPDLYDCTGMSNSGPNSVRAEV